jgi:hypothetical protein
MVEVHQENELRRWDLIRDQILFVIDKGLAFCDQEGQDVAHAQKATSAPPA